MNHKIIFLFFLPLLWTLISEAQGEPKIEVRTVSGKIEVSCGEGYTIETPTGPELSEKIQLDYKDKESGEYKCQKDGSTTTIFVKLRTCDNCIEFDPGSIAGIAIGEIVATIVLGVAVYLVASQAQSGPVMSNKKSSDRQHLVTNEVSHRPNNDQYQPLKLRGVTKDTYDVLSPNRK